MRMNTSPSPSPRTTTSELEALAADRPLSTVEQFKPNDFYGHAAWLKRCAGLPADFVIRAVMPHGPSFCSRLWATELKDPCRSILAISHQQRALYEQQSPDKSVQVIGSPLLYVARWMESELKETRASARGTLVFPTHSTHHVTVEFDVAGFIRHLKSLPAEFQPVRVCLYWRDIQLGRHREYQAAGLDCVTAGHMFDPEFIPRLLRLLASHRHAIANKLGSAVYYAAACGLPVQLFEQPTQYTGPNPAQLAELSPSLDLPAAVKFAATAHLSLADALPLQRALALQELGADAVLSTDALRACLEALPPQPQPKSSRPRPAQSKTDGPSKATAARYTAEATLANLIPTLRPLVAGHPRRVPGRIKLDDRPLAYADLHSLYHQSQQIFGQKLYEFRSTSPEPLIVDGGAHIGLAALYFARRFPRATIHAFEADPQIAGLLAANVGAFELKQVHVHARALWTSNDGVAFAATADDSGHVLQRSSVGPSSVGRVSVEPHLLRQDQGSTESRPTKGGPAVISSIRLRDFLGRQTRPVDLLKLDIEGAEFAVLADCDGALDRVNHLLIEAHRFRDDDGQLGELLGVLERNGFDYALGDLHAATWIESSDTPPFAACKSRHYIVTVFAWRPVPARVLPGDDAVRPVRSDRGPSVNVPAVSTPAHAGHVPDAVLREAIAHLNARREAEALRCFDQAIRSGLGCRPRFGRSVALARLNRRDEAVAELRGLLKVEPGHRRAQALIEELTPAAAPSASSSRLYIASFPRSGNTWVRLLLSDLILQQHGYATDTTLPIHADYIIPDLHVGKAEDVDQRLRLPGLLLKSHDRFDQLAPGRAVCIFRQAADALVSYYHFHLRYPNLAPKAAAGVDRFCRDHVEKWKAHLRSFLEARERGAEVFFVSYESIHAESARTLGNIARFIGLTAGEAACRQAVENHGFAKQQAAEKQAHGDKYAVPFFRQGQVNGAARELTPETLAFLAAETTELYESALAAERACDHEPESKL